MDDLHRLNPICQTHFPQNINAAKPGVIRKQKRSSFKPVFLLEILSTKKEGKKERKLSKSKNEENYNQRKENKTTSFDII